MCFRATSFLCVCVCHELGLLICWSLCLLEEQPLYPATFVLSWGGASLILGTGRLLPSLYRRKGLAVIRFNFSSKAGFLGKVRCLHVPYLLTLSSTLIALFHFLLHLTTVAGVHLAQCSKVPAFARSGGKNCLQERH